MEIPTLKELKLDTTKFTQSTTPKASVLYFKSKQPLNGGGGYGTGRRKNSIAKVWVRPGKGQITVNSKDFTIYFPRESYRSKILQIFNDTGTIGQFDVVCRTSGGGTTGQAGAIIHGIARALDCISTDYHYILRKNGFLTRDPRVVERKKYGKHKARKSTQFSKR